MENFKKCKCNNALKREKVTNVRIQIKKYLKHIKMTLDFKLLIQIENVMNKTKEIPVTS